MNLLMKLYSNISCHAFSGFILTLSQLEWWKFSIVESCFDQVLPERYNSWHCQIKRFC